MEGREGKGGEGSGGEGRGRRGGNGAPRVLIDVSVSNFLLYFPLSPSVSISLACGV